MFLAETSAEVVSAIADGVIRIIREVGIPVGFGGGAMVLIGLWIRAWGKRRAKGND